MKTTTTWILKLPFSYFKCRNQKRLNTSDLWLERQVGETEKREGRPACLGSMVSRYSKYVGYLIFFFCNGD